MRSRNAVRTVVIGYGFAGRCFHSYLVGLAPGLALHGIASRDSETRARIVAERRCRAYESFEEAVTDPSVELVVLATPNATHADLAVRALDAGKHVVTDKVMCTSLADCDRMIDAAERNGRFLSVFQNRRWDGDFLTIAALIERGDIGDVRWIEMAWQGFGAPGGWRGKAGSGGGRFWDLGAHLVDQMALLCPEPIERVWCRMHHDYLPVSDVDSEALIVISFANGRTGVCDLSGRTKAPKPRFLLHGSTGTFVKHGLDPQERAMIAGAIDTAVEPEANYGRILPATGEEITVPTLPGRWRTYYENVADAILHGAPSYVPLAESRRTMAIMDAANRSAQSGEAIRPVV